jgi:hypothetical protein
MKLDKIELLLLTSAMIALLTSSYKFVHYKNNTELIEKNKKIATLIVKRNEVQRKFNNSLAWSGISQEENLYNKDKLFTHEKSIAEIHYDDESVISLSPKTLIKINKFDGKNQVDLIRGDLDIKVTKKSKLKMKIGKKVFNINSKSSNTKIKIKKPKKNQNFKISVISGKAQIKTKDKEIVLTKKQEIIISNIKNTKFKIRNISIVNNRPINNKNIKIKSNQTIKFSWDGDKNITEYHLEISRSHLFKNIIRKIKTNKSYASASFQEKGLYFWRVKKENTSISSNTHSFKLTLIEKPVILFPTQKYILKPDKDKKNVLTISWKTTSNQKHEIEIAKKTAKKTKKTTTNKFLTLTNLAKGNYKIRVRSFHGNIKSVWSDTVIFNVQGKYIRQKPVIKNNNKIKKIYLNIVNNPYINILLDSNIDQKNFSIEFYKIENKVKKIYEDILIGKNYKWKINNIGKYKVQIKDNEINKTSSTKIIHAILKAPYLNKPKNGKKIILLKPTSSLNFKWTKDTTQYFQLEISKDHKFKNVILKKIINNNTFNWKKPQIGTYFWRVKVKTKWGEEFSNTVNKFILKKPPRIKIPSFPNKIPLKIKIIYFIDDFSDQVNELIAYKSKHTQIVNIKVPAIKNVKSYTFEIYKNRKLNKKIYSITKNNPNIMWKKVKPGKYYMLISVTDYWGRVTKSKKPVILKVAHDKKNFKPAKIYKLKKRIFKQNAVNKNGVFFKWSRPKYSSTFEFILYKHTEKSKKIIFSKKTTKRTIRLIKTLKNKSGVFSVQIVTRYPQGYKIRSLRNEFQIKKPSILTNQKESKRKKIKVKPFENRKKNTGLSLIDTSHSILYHTIYNDFSQVSSGTTISSKRNMFGNFEFYNKLNFNIFEIAINFSYLNGNLYNGPNYKNISGSIPVSKRFNLLKDLTVSPFLDLEYLNISEYSGAYTGLANTQNSIILFNLGLESKYRINENHSIESYFSYGFSKYTNIKAKVNYIFNITNKHSLILGGEYSKKSKSSDDSTVKISDIKSTFGYRYLWSIKQ